MDSATRMNIISMHTRSMQIDPNLLTITVSAFLPNPASYQTARVLDRGAFATVYLLQKQRSGRGRSAEDEVVVRVSTRPVYNDTARREEKDKIRGFVGILQLLATSTRSETITPLIPRILAYDASPECAFGHGWIAMTRLPGRQLSECFNDMDFTQKRRLVNDLSRFVTALAMVGGRNANTPPFDKISSFATTGDAGSVGPVSRHANEIQGFDKTYDLEPIKLLQPKRHGANNLRPIPSDLPSSESPSRSRDGSRVGNKGRPPSIHLELMDSNPLSQIIDRTLGSTTAASATTSTTVPVSAGPFATSFLLSASSSSSSPFIPTPASLASPYPLPLSPVRDQHGFPNSTSKFLQAAIDDEITWLKHHQGEAVKCYNANMRKLQLSGMAEEIPLGDGAMPGSCHTNVYKRILNTLSRLIEEEVTADVNLSGEEEQFGLAHLDLSMENLLVDEDTGELKGVVDWEFAGAVPKWLSRGFPEWLACQREEIVPIPEWDADTAQWTADPEGDDDEDDLEQLRQEWLKTMYAGEEHLHEKETCLRTAREVAMMEWHQLGKASAWVRGFLSSKPPKRPRHASPSSSPVMKWLGLSVSPVPSPMVSPLISAVSPLPPTLSPLAFQKRPLTPLMCFQSLDTEVEIESLSLPPSVVEEVKVPTFCITTTSSEDEEDEEEAEEIICVQGLQRTISRDSIISESAADSGSGSEACASSAADAESEVGLGLFVRFGRRALNTIDSDDESDSDESSSDKEDEDDSDDDNEDEDDDDDDSSTISLDLNDNAWQLEFEDCFGSGLTVQTSRPKPATTPLAPSICSISSVSLSVTVCGRITSATLTSSDSLQTISSQRQSTSQQQQRQQAQRAAFIKALNTCWDAETSEKIDPKWKIFWDGMRRAVSAVKEDDFDFVVERDLDAGW